MFPVICKTLLIFLLFGIHAQSVISERPIANRTNESVNGILIIGGNSKTIEMYSPTRGSSIINITLPFDVPICAGAHRLKDGRILVIDTDCKSPADHPSGRTVVLDVCTRRATEGPQMSNNRSWASSTAADGVVTVCGGCDADLLPAYKSQANCETTDYGSPWTISPGPMQVPRFGHTLTTLQDHSMLAIGGTYDSRGLIDCIERLKGTKWTTIEKWMANLASVESYVAGKWTAESHSLLSPRSDHCAIAVDIQCSADYEE